MSTRVTVGNLNHSTTANHLHGLFNRSGLVLSVSVSNEKFGQTGTVDMSSPESAAAAVAALDGSMLHEHQITVRVD